MEGTSLCEIFLEKNTGEGDVYFRLKSKEFLQFCVPGHVCSQQTKLSKHLNTKIKFPRAKAPNKLDS